MSGVARRMFVLQYGAERVSKTLSLRGGPAELGWEPLPGVLVETAEGWILFDTGMSRRNLDDPRAQALYREGAVAEGHDPRTPTPALHPEPPDPHAWAWGLPGNPLETALATVGLRPSDLSLAVVSHLHLDHSGGIATLSEAGVPVAIQREELAFAREGGARYDEGFVADDWSHPDTRWRALDGDTELAPGVEVVSTPGHTPGHSSLRVDLPQTGTWLFAGDAADLAQNFLDRVPCGYAAGGTAEDERRADASLARLLALAAESDARIVPGHDQLVLTAVRHPVDGHC
jgi:N-acyl homoserine lactone hydrolase